MLLKHAVVILMSVSPENPSTTKGATIGLRQSVHPVSKIWDRGIEINIGQYLIIYVSWLMRNG